MYWTLIGTEYEVVGIDNVRAVSCLDTIPSLAPSDAPSMSPTAAPVPQLRPNPRLAPVPGADFDSEEEQQGERRE